MAQPILYSFRRCPYAIRARLALYFSGISVELREVVLRDKPKEMLQISPKGTVPVLVIGERVIDESLDVMKWALDEVGWCDPNIDFDLIERNDTEFKPLLDRYKYFDRHPEKSREEHLEAALPYLAFLDNKLEIDSHLSGEDLGFEDAAIFPFIRQFANSDRDWFDRSDFQTLRAWLQSWENSEVFKGVMVKYAQWVPSQDVVTFPST